MEFNAETFRLLSFFSLWKSKHVVFSSINHLCSNNQYLNNLKPLSNFHILTHEFFDVGGCYCGGLSRKIFYSSMLIIKTIFVANEFFLLKSNIKRQSSKMLFLKIENKKIPKNNENCMRIEQQFEYVYQNRIPPSIQKYQSNQQKLIHLLTGCKAALALEKEKFSALTSLTSSLSSLTHLPRCSAFRFSETIKDAGI
ncbi:hypothetical protein BpHYR1_011275 [Brachionus plicatilis]|uniref:Uncharacterized protein n=1 Tax=Brachionus plicatilis TaxID=10195 RepID=A0A3M7QSN7_BRAPC|nr:hypothetical protein BpHYR1_011275 [Brachionus plicatilis]